MRRSLAVSLLFVLLAACGGGGGDDDDVAEEETTTTAFDRAAATAEITAMWTQQFSEGQTVDAAVANLENGETYRDAIIQQQTSGATRGLSVQVKDVQVTSPTVATVTYDILLSGNVALAGTKGNAVRIDGKWKVSEQHFCVLLSLGQINPPACEAVLNPAQPTTST
jgi:hypothetical protein